MEAGHRVWVARRSPGTSRYGTSLVYQVDGIGKLLEQFARPDVALDDAAGSAAAGSTVGGEPSADGDGDARADREASADRQSYAIVNLAGESINSGRWTAARKQQILNSRLRTTAAIVDAIHAVTNKPWVLINASAVGYYPYSDGPAYTEDADCGRGFLSQVTQQWEMAALQASDVTRVVTARLGMVIGREGGALPRMVLPYRLFGGGRMGSGEQWVSWVHAEDVADILRFCLETEQVTGPVNVVSPTPVRMNEFGRTIAKATNRPHWLPVPAFALKAGLGEMSEIVLQGQRVTPAKLTQLGYTFRYAELEPALADLLHGPGPGQS